jgi:hypothetical protein
MDGVIGGMKIGRGKRSTLRKPAAAPLCPPQNPHDCLFSIYFVDEGASFTDIDVNYYVIIIKRRIPYPNYFQYFYIGARFRHIYRGFAAVELSAPARELPMSSG